MVQNPHDNDFSIEDGIFPQCRRDQDSVLPVTITFEGAADKYPPEPAHAVAFFGQGQDLSFDFFPVGQRISHQAVVHPRNHQTRISAVLNGFAKPFWDNYSALGIDGME